MKAESNPTDDGTVGGTADSELSPRSNQPVGWPLGAGFFEQALETAPDGIIIVDSSGAIRFVNRQAEALLGWARSDLLGRPIEVVVPERSRKHHPAHRSRYLATPDTRPMATRVELAARRGDGTELPVDISLSPLRTEEGLWVSAAIRDATARKAAESELRSAYERLTATVTEMERQREELAVVSEMADMLQSCLHLDEAYSVVAAAAEKLFSGTKGAIYRPNLTPTSLEAVSTWGRTAIGLPVMSMNDCWALRKGRPHGRQRAHIMYPCPHVPNAEAGWSLCLPLLAHGEILGLLHLRADGVSEVSELSRQAATSASTMAEHLSLAVANLRLRENLRRQSERDALTGLFNRRYLDARLEKEVRRARDHDLPLTLVLVDVDNFKHVNDSLSHADGDICLRDVARILTAHLRPGDTACRFGGDEFAVLLPDVSVEVALDRTSEIRRLVESETHATISAGVAELSESVLTADQLFRECDRLLRQAKHAGKNQIIGNTAARLPLQQPLPPAR